MFRQSTDSPGTWACSTLDLHVYAAGAKGMTSTDL